MPPLSFQEAIRETTELLDALSTASSGDCYERVAQVISTVEGGRGFFVALLTGSSRLADDPPPQLIDALKRSPTIVSDLLAKNLVMSTTMALTHRRNNNAEMEAGSLKVAERTEKLIALMPELCERMKVMSRAVNANLAGLPDDEDPDRRFLQRWNYDREQLRLAAEALNKAISGIS